MIIPLTSVDLPASIAQGYSETDYANPNTGEQDVFLSSGFILIHI